MFYPITKILLYFSSFWRKWSRQNWSNLSFSWAEKGDLFLSGERDRDKNVEICHFPVQKSANRRFHLMFKKNVLSNRAFQNTCLFYKKWFLLVKTQIVVALVKFPSNWPRMKKIISSISYCRKDSLFCYFLCWIFELKSIVRASAVGLCWFKKIMWLLRALSLHLLRSVLCNLTSDWSDRLNTEENSWNKGNEAPISDLSLNLIPERSSYEIWRPIIIV